MSKNFIVRTITQVSSYRKEVSSWDKLIKYKRRTFLRYVNKKKKRTTNNKAALKLLEMIEYIEIKNVENVIDIGSAPGNMLKILLSKFKNIFISTMTKRFHIDLKINQIKSFKSLLKENKLQLQPGDGNVFKLKSVMLMKPEVDIDLVICDAGTEINYKSKKENHFIALKNILQVFKSSQIICKIQNFGHSLTYKTLTFLLKKSKERKQHLIFCKPEYSWLCNDEMYIIFTNKKGYNASNSLHTLENEIIKMKDFRYNIRTQFLQK